MPVVKGLGFLKRLLINVEAHLQEYVADSILYDELVITPPIGGNATPQICGVAATIAVWRGNGNIFSGKQIPRRSHTVADTADGGQGKYRTNQEQVPAIADGGLWGGPLVALLGLPGGDVKLFRSGRLLRMFVLQGPYDRTKPNSCWHREKRHTSDNRYVDDLGTPRFPRGFDWRDP